MARIDTVLTEVQKETERFLERLIAARNRFSQEEYYIRGCKESAALKRAALDLKQELTKITQSTNY